MARCSFCLGDPCVCPWTPKGLAPPMRLTAGVALWTLRRRRGDVVDRAAQLTFAVLGSALLYVLILAGQR